MMRCAETIQFCSIQFGAKLRVQIKRPPPPPPRLVSPRHIIVMIRPSRSRSRLLNLPGARRPQPSVFFRQI